MKYSKLAISFGVITLGSTGLQTAAIAASADGSASAEIITPVTVSQDGGQTMNFGIITPATTGNGDTVVSLTAAASTARSLDSGAGALVTGGTVSSGKFNITGASGYLVNISATDTANELSNGTDTLSFSAPSVSTASHTIAGDATDTFYVGGTLTIPEAVSSGTYTNPAAFTVTVNYN